MLARLEIIAVMVLFACGACAQQKQNTWDNIDYSKVYKAAGERRDIDTGYRAPSVVGCVDDDLYNCR